jgi:hypothetical protein
MIEDYLSLIFLSPYNITISIRYDTIKIIIGFKSLKFLKQRLFITFTNVVALSMKI